MESQATTVAGAESQPSTPSTLRLVIRVKIPQETPRPPARRLSSGVLLIIGIAAVLLTWVGISMFGADPTSAPATTEVAPNSKSQSPASVPASSEAAPVVRNEPLPQPATGTAETRSSKAKPDAAPSPINEAIPDVPRSARETIRGTIRVSVRVIVDKDGTVLSATADEPGPSRYFERLAIAAAKKWTFTPAASAAQRTMLVTFNVTRAGTTARANSVQ